MNRRIFGRRYILIISNLNEETPQEEQEATEEVPEQTIERPGTPMRDQSRFRDVVSMVYEVLVNSMQSEFDKLYHDRAINAHAYAFCTRACGKALDSIDEFSRGVEGGERKSRWDLLRTQHQGSKVPSPLHMPRP